MIALGLGLGIAVFAIIDALGDLGARCRPHHSPRAGRGLSDAPSGPAILAALLALSFTGIGLWLETPPLVVDRMEQSHD